jgi:hypothetical protein
LEFEKTRRPSTLQKLQPSSILNRVVAVGLATFQLPPLQDTPPISMTDLLQVVGFLYGKIWLTYYKRLVFDMDKFLHGYIKNEQSFVLDLALIDEDLDLNIELWTFCKEYKVGS